MRFWYNLFFTLFFYLSAPYYFRRMRRRGNWKAGFNERFGKYDTYLKTAITNRHTLWMHAVSVGEVNIATELIRALETRMPNLKIVVSTTTSTGMAELKKKAAQPRPQDLLSDRPPEVRFPRTAGGVARSHRSRGGRDLAELSLGREVARDSHLPR